MSNQQTPSETRTIEGFAYEVYALPAWQALEVFQTLTQALAPVVGAVTKADAGDGVAAIGAAVERVFQAMPPKEVQRVSKLLLGRARVTLEDGRSIELLPIVDVHFQRRTLALWRVLAFAVEVNFPDFLVTLRGLGGRLAAKVGTALQPIPSIATGPAGD